MITRSLKRTISEAEKNKQEVFNRIRVKRQQQFFAYVGEEVAEITALDHEICEAKEALRIAEIQAGQ